MKSRWKMWLIPLLIILFTGMAFKSADFKKDEKVALSKQPKQVAIRGIDLLEKEENITLNGDILPFQEACISAKIAAKANSIKVKNGTNVVEGQLLLMLEQVDYQNALSIAEAALDKTEAGLYKSELDYNRCQELYEQGVISKSIYDDADIALRVAKADVKAAHAAVINARESVSNTRIMAPFAGLVADCDIHAGEIVNPGLHLMRIIDISSVYVVVNIKQEDMARVESGQEAVINVPGLDERAFAGTVTAINSAGDTDARVFAVKIKVDNEKELLKPGMFATVEIKTGKTGEVLAVPANTVIEQSGLYYVFIIEGQEARQREVKTGAMIGDMVAIQSGLAKDQQIIVSNVNSLKDGDLIEICR